MFCSEKVKETTISYLSLQAYQTDKSALRAAVNNAMVLMKDKGAYLDNGSIKSLYYTSASWQNFMTAYKTHLHHTLAECTIAQHFHYSCLFSCLKI